MAIQIRDGRKTWTWLKFYNAIMDEVNEYTGEFYTYNMVKEAIDTALHYLYKVLKDFGIFERFSLYKVSTFTANPISITDGYDIYRVYRKNADDGIEYPCSVFSSADYTDLKYSAYYGESEFSPLCVINYDSSSYLNLSVFPAPDTNNPVRVIYFIYPEIPTFEDATDNIADFPFEDDLVPFLLKFIIGVLLFNPHSGVDAQIAIAYQAEAKKYLFETLGIVINEGQK